MYSTFFYEMHFVYDTLNHYHDNLKVVNYKIQPQDILGKYEMYVLYYMDQPTTVFNIIMSRIARKPVFAVSEQVRHKLDCVELQNMARGF